MKTLPTPTLPPVDLKAFFTAAALAGYLASPRAGETESPDENGRYNDKTYIVNYALRIGEMLYEAYTEENPPEDGGDDVREFNKKVLR